MVNIFTSEGAMEIIKVTGYIGIFGIVFAESGLFVGFFLPGDSLLFTAGFLASQGFINLWLTIALVFVGAVLGDSVGYSFGRKVGPKIFKKEDSKIFHKYNLKKAEAFYEEHGPKTIILARFIPIIRTFAPIVAGIGQMHYRKFLAYNVIGGFLWAFGVTLAGYFLGKTIPGIDKYLLPIILGIIVISVIPPAIHILKSRRKK